MEETKALLESTKASNGAGQAEILDAQLTLLQDEYSVVEPILEKIGDERCNAAHAADSVLSEIAAMFAQADDEYLSQRAADVKDIRERLLLHILEQERVHFDALPEDTILVAAELTPSDTIRLDLRHIAGIATETGGYYSHTGIITRNLGIPAVSGLEFDLDGRYVRDRGRRDGTFHPLAERGGTAGVPARAGGACARRLESGAVPYPEELYGRRRRGLYLR